MKKCMNCGSENEEPADSCRGCGHRDFGLKHEPLIQVPEKAAVRQPIPAASLAVKEGTAMILKCRTPGEAFLVAQELEAADIIAILPEEESLIADYQRDGYVTVKVSAQAYEAAKELRSVIERGHWEARTQIPLPPGMKALAIGLGPIIGLGWILFGMIREYYKEKGYGLKKKQFERWFLGGALLWLILIIVLTRRRTFG